MAIYSSPNSISGMDVDRKVLPAPSSLSLMGALHVVNAPIYMQRVGVWKTWRCVTEHVFVCTECDEHDCHTFLLIVLWITPHFTLMWFLLHACMFTSGLGSGKLKGKGGK